MMLSQIPIYTKVKNLYLTGQNINLHGICGVPLTAVNTAEAILGENTIIINSTRYDKTALPDALLLGNGTEQRGEDTNGIIGYAVYRLSWGQLLLA